MSNPSLAQPLPPKPVLDSVFGQVWPDAATPGRPRILAGAAAVGLLAAIVLPFRLPGLGTWLVLVAVVGVVVAARERLSRGDVAAVALCLALTSTVVLRDAFWVVALCLLAAFAVGAATLSAGRSLMGLLASVAAVPLAAVRGLPWLGRSMRGTTSGTSAGTWWSLLRTAAISVLLVAVFGALFASADAVFARWAGALVPDLTLDTAFLRGFVFLAVAGLTLAGAYVALCPPRVERLALPAGRPVPRAFEWVVPVGLVVAVFAAFVAAQLTVMFGGHAYLRRTTGLTYADYVHQGFGQLTVATALTLAVVAVAVRKAPRATERERVLLRLLLGALCLLTLVVVASALYRVHVYEEAYGFTRLRLLVSVFEGWLGLVLALVLVAGLRLHGPWVPRAALLGGALLLLGLAVSNPDASIAERSVARFEQTGRIDVQYLSGLSADAAPALADLPASYRACLGPEATNRDWLEWNLGRARASGVVPTDGDAVGTCDPDTVQGDGP